MSDAFWSWLSIGALFVFCVATVTLYSRYQKNPRFHWVRFVSRVAIFAAFSTILYLVPVFQISLPFVPFFMQLHFDEVPAMVGGYAYGPWVGAAVILVKTIVKLPMTHTLGVGELADFVFSMAYILPATLVYQKRRNMKGVLIGFALGTVTQLLTAMTLNVYWILPFYLTVMDFSPEYLLEACQRAVPQIRDLGWSYAFWGVLPINLIKDALVFALTFLTYRSIRKALHWETADPKPSPTQAGE